MVQSERRVFGSAPFLDPEAPPLRVNQLSAPEGGWLRPHKSHQNGLSADFFVPVVDAGGRPSKLPISAVKKLG